MSARNIRRLLDALTAPSMTISPLMTAVIVFTTLELFNSVLLSPWNHLRCTFWDQGSCSRDIGWILNWLAFSKFHVAVLLGCLSASSLGYGWAETKIAHLCSAILISFITQGIFSLEYLNRPMAAFQGFILVALLIAINFWISIQEQQPGSAYLAMPFRSQSLSTTQRKKIAVPTLALIVQVIVSVLRVIDMTFGGGKDGYIGDSSSKIFVNISNMAVCEMMLASCIMLFATIYCTIDQHRALLKGQAVSLFLSAHVLGSAQGEMIEKSQVKAAMVGTFTSIVLAVVGGL